MSMPMPEIQRKVSQHSEDIMAIYDMLTRLEDKVDGHTDRLDRIDTRLDRMDQRLDGMEGQLSRVIDLLEER